MTIQSVIVNSFLLEIYNFYYIKLKFQYKNTIFVPAGVAVGSGSAPLAAAGPGAAPTTTVREQQHAETGG
jgi:hypothetical protein